MLLALLLLSSMLMLSRDTKPAEASGTIYIRADGSIDPSDAPISTYDNVTYTLTGNITTGDADGMVVERDNIVIDGAGYTVSGNRRGTGIMLTDRTNVTARKMTVCYFDEGILLRNSSESVLSDNNVTINQWGGITLSFSSFNNTLSRNKVAGSVNGIHLSNSSGNALFDNNIIGNNIGIVFGQYSSDNRLLGNEVRENSLGGIELYPYSDNNVFSDNIVLDNGYQANVGYGIEFMSSSNNTLSGNVMGGNRYNLGVEGSALSHYLHSIDASNQVNGRSVHYLMNQSDIMINADTYPEVGYLGLVNCVNVTVQGLNLTNNCQGVLVAFTNDSRISDNNVQNNAYGIVLGSSFDNIISRNNVTSSQMFGIVLGSMQGSPDFSSNNNILSGNNIADTHYYNGIWLISSSNNTLVDNNVTASFQDGIMLSQSSNNNTLFRNNVINNDYGIYLHSSSNNNVSGNNIANNHDGIQLSDSSSNSIYHNNFIDNKVQVFLYSGEVNTWDDGYPFGGNFWSDYNGTDIYQGPYQDATGSDGIGDAPYIVDVSNADNYPLMKPYPWDQHDIGVTYIGRVYFEIALVPIPLRTVMGVNILLHFNVFVMNYGNCTEAFNVTAYANSTIIDTITDAALTARNSAILNFTWDTAGFTIGNYTLSVHADPVQGETSTIDNTFIDGVIYVSIPGDINADGIVEMMDFFEASNAYNSQPGMPNWNPNADINDDGIVEMMDFFIMSQHYLKHT
jgi:parallel beta-helix repeat protein